MISLSNIIQIKLLDQFYGERDIKNIERATGKTEIGEYLCSNIWSEYKVN